MAHDLHFLERLSRVTDADQEQALSLYHEPELVRTMLDLATLPEGCERIALALWNQPDGPHVIVNRQGRFVTCLGEGMGIGECPELTRHQLEGLKVRALRWREAQALVEPERMSDSRQALARIATAGPMLSREDFHVAAALAPILGGRYLAKALDSETSAFAIRDSLRGLSHTSSLKRKEDYQRARTLFDLFWASAHYWVLTSLTPHFVRELGAEHLHQMRPVWTGLRSLNLGVLFRTLWAMSRLGLLFPAARGGYARYETPTRFYESVLSLFALAWRHSKLRAEVIDLMERRQAPPTFSEASRLVLSDTFRCSVQNSIAGVLRTATPMRWVLGDMTRHAYEDRPKEYAEFARFEDIPRDLVEFDAVTNNVLLEWPECSLVVCVHLPAVVELEAECLYLPKHLHPKEGYEPSRDLLYAHASAQAKIARRPRTVRKEVRPERNDPCPCGSGRKYKQCCAGKA